MPFLAVTGISAGTGILSGIFGRNAAKDAASAQVKNAIIAQDAVNTNTKTSLDAVDTNTTNANTQWQKILDTNMGLIKPYTDVGETATAGLNDALKNPFQFDITQDPGYAFRLAQGQKAVEGSAAARGGALSGGALKALTQYGQGFASNEYQNAFQRHQAQLNNLFQGAGLGLSAANTGVSAGNAFALGTSGNLNENSSLISQILGQNSNLATQNFTGIGNAQAAGAVGAANAFNGGLNSLSNAVNQGFLYSLLSNSGKGAYGQLPTSGLPTPTYRMPAPNVGSVPGIELDPSAWGIIVG